MAPTLSPDEQVLTHGLIHLPSTFSNRFTPAADRHLRRILFRSLASQRSDFLHLFFPAGPPTNDSKPWSLRDAQGALDGAEYTAAARGTACGHIFKSGESTYHCKTCAADDTCVLCARCFEASEHEGHLVFISVSPGNSGCCDCGDREAWRREMRCGIHSAEETGEGEPGLGGRGAQALGAGGKEKAMGNGEALPEPLVEAIRMTIARAVDYLCDVFSCSPEQLRLPKTEANIREDERLSRLGGAYGEEPLDEETEYALVLWNDEKHTVNDVENQVARACSKSKKFGFDRAMQVNDVGRSIIHYSTDVPELLRMAGIIEQLKLTVTIRSARDTFREQMCATIIDWISDIAGCSVGSDSATLRNVICEELLKPWRPSSHASNKDPGKDGIDDHEIEDNEGLRRQYRSFFNMLPIPGLAMAAELPRGDEEGDEGDEDAGDDADEVDAEYVELEDSDMGFDQMDVDVDDIREAAQVALNATVADADMDIDHLDETEDMTEALEATLAGYPPPPRPPNAAQRRQVATPADSDDGEAEQLERPASNAPYENVPKTPKNRSVTKRPPRPSRYWLEKPETFKWPRPSEPCEDLWQRVRLDFLILYDLRLWKTLRISLRHLHITTVVTIPHFKRILGLRFAGLYTALAQLYLIADREPDHSIINLSVQMLTTPTLTQEVVERGNFLTNLMAILYTFLTTRQVGFPEDVSPRASLAFDAGAVTNRRMFHFFLDLRWLFQSEFVQYRMRIEPRYLLQFLDLVKLHQGVCPNVRALGEHVEYESDTWISASMIVKEINKLCKQVAVSFAPRDDTDDSEAHLHRAIRTVAQVTMINSFGYERKRFQVAELKEVLGWHVVGPFEDSGKLYSVPKYAVQAEPMSFHHPLHYMLSWLFEAAKKMSREELRALLLFHSEDLKDPWNILRTQPAPADLTSDKLLCSVFDHPLRVCVWLAQMKAGMWVRNGITLRHQANTYRSVSHRDVGYQRDILMVQTGFVLCGNEKELKGERFLSQLIDRFQMTNWFKGDYSLLVGFEESQQIDVIEDLFHLIVIVLSERGNLVPGSDARAQHSKVLQHDIAHALCFKPLSFSDLAGRVTEKVGESDDFDAVLQNMTIFRPPEGLNDTGTFELKPEYIELVDPYYAHYSRNHREEAENIFKKHMASKTGKTPEEVVFEPKLSPITSGLFMHLTSFTATPLFTQVIATALNFAAGVKKHGSKQQVIRVPVTRVETLLHMVLHLVMIATIEDENQTTTDGFIKLATSPQNFMTSSNQQSVVSALVSLSAMEEYTSCHPTIKHILRKMQARQPERLAIVMGPACALLDRAEAASPASMSAEDKDKKKQEALARQARIMAKMKEQQNSFLQNQGISLGDDLEDLDEDEMSVTGEQEGAAKKKLWSFPTGTCIWCQEETDDQRLYGTFAYLGESNIWRSTPVLDPDYVNEVIDTPQSLDRSAEHIRPFGVAGRNRQTAHKIGSDGVAVNVEKQALSKGFPHQAHNPAGAVATSCGHIMHWSCFLLYLDNSRRRHNSQIARNHPEHLELKEFTCPLCKALGNMFLPIIWKAKECSEDHDLHAAKPLGDWLLSIDSRYTAETSPTDSSEIAHHRHRRIQDFYSSRSAQYVNSMFVPSLVASLNELSLESSPGGSSQQVRWPDLRDVGVRSSIARLLSGRRTESQSSIDTMGLSPQSDPPGRMKELTDAYTRVGDTIRANRIWTFETFDDSTFSPVGPLSRALGLSISAFEIAHRGVGSDPFATSLLSELSEQTLTQLRVLSETIESYLAVNVLRPQPNLPVAQETVKKRDALVALLFGGDSAPSKTRQRETLGKTVLQDDIFLFFVDWLLFMAPGIAEAASILQLCYWAEIVKTIVVYNRVITREGMEAKLHTPSERSSSPFLHGFAAAATTIASEDASTSPSWSTVQTELMRVLVDKYALAFLRKCIVVMHVRFGLDFQCPYDLSAEMPELARLTALLHMPSIDELCAEYTAQSPSGDKFRTITNGWVAKTFPTSNDPGSRLGLFVAHPAIFELVGLPRNYDALTEEAIRRKCPTTGKEITDPAICLECGAVFCSQAVCCAKHKNKGGCFQHMVQNASKVGIFLNVRKCMVVFLHGPGNGSYVHAPYLDKHGEPDPTLRRHHQLFLNQRRYDKLMRDVWLQHLIPTVISRKLEADINPGGWETL